jgi:hypothetical protein
MPCTRTAKIPATGGFRFSGMFAVGNPSVRPSLAPCATGPGSRIHVRGAPWRERGRPPQGLREPRGRSALAFDRHGAHGFDAELLRCAAQRGEVACTALAETKVLADEQPAHAQTRDQDAIDERLRIERCEPGVEPRDVSARDAVRGERFDLVAQRRKTRGRARFGEEFARRRSNVSTADGNARSSAASTSRDSIARWPRWTPSKFPIVNAT